MPVRIIPTGEVISDRKFEQIQWLCRRLHAGVISGLEFERQMRKLGYTRAKAYALCNYIRRKQYEVIVPPPTPPPLPPPPKVIKWVRVMVAASLTTTSEKGPSSERYFEGRIFAPVPYSLKDDVPGGEVPPLMTCDELDYLGDFFMKCIYIYFESKGYDVPMLDTADWKAGVQYLDEFEDVEDMDIVFKCEIYDLGSANRPMSIRRWADNIEMIKKYWEDLPKACRHFRDKAFEVGYLKSMGKQVRW